MKRRPGARARICSRKRPRLRIAATFSKINDVRENLLDIAARIRLAQKTIREVEKKAKDDGEDYARKLETIAAGQDKSRRAKKELTEANLRSSSASPSATPIAGSASSTDPGRPISA